ncbi:hypothetical protein [Marinobacter xiaoshiensis]|uniref:Cthe-2314-like HEPN domain-containing protein n=1 Tax=Marinobacter xiaoshiensis TaxID=3073652 RepID=A0ABU2HJ76_9GAMM|nr:hypothetical protein [Marinobacter sp. F60267]MDS1311104.1 hypothetical protein [Marinobacter sp. F60267]
MPLNHTSQYAELTDEHFTAIGKIVVEWSNIEFLLGLLLSRLLITPEFLARSYTDHMSAVKLQEAIKEGVEIHKQRYGCKLIDEVELEKIINLNNRVTALRSTRNKFAHFCWSRSTDEKIFGTNLSGGVPSSKKHKKSYITFTVAELSRFHQEARMLVDELSSLVKSLPEMEEDGLTSKVTGRWTSPTSVDTHR